MSTRSMLDVLAGTAMPTTVIAENSTAERAVPVTPVNKSAHADIALVPYNAVFDPQAVDFLAWMWKRMQEDDLVDYYFPGQKETGYAQFVRMMSGDANVGIVRRIVDSTQWKDVVAGFISWTPLYLGNKHFAVAGLVFFREYWDHHTTDDAGKLALHYWFAERDDIDSVLGVCPSLHVAITRYNKRMGFRECGQLSGAHIFKGNVCNATLFEITKDEWLMRGDK